MNLVNIAAKGREIILFTRDGDKLNITRDNSLYPYYYEVDPNGQYKTYDGKRAKIMFVSEPKAIKKQASKNSYEADVNFIQRYMIDKIKVIDKVNVKYCFLDIEVYCKDFPNIQEAKYPISCISIWNSETQAVKTYYLPTYGTEKQMLKDFAEYLKIEQFDAILVWNLKFDVTYIFNRWTKLFGHRAQNFAEASSPVGMCRRAEFGAFITQQDRDEVEGVFFPAGTSWIDYMQWYKRYTRGQRASYKLDYIAQEDLGEETWGEEDFGDMSESVKAKNINDVIRMSKIDAKYNLVDYFDRLRRQTISVWEDLYHFSRLYDSMFLREAKAKGIVLPNKKSMDEAEDFEGAYRAVYAKGRHYGVTSFDLSGAYMYTPVNYCLDQANIVSEPTANSIPVVITDRETNSPIKTIYVKQSDNALVPTIIKRLIDEKNKLKAQRDALDPSTPEYKDKELEYDSYKSFSLSSWGVCGAKGFRLYSSEISSAITSIVRSILHYVKAKVVERGYELVYADTDGVMIKTEGVNICDWLNELLHEWSMTNFGKPTDIRFDYEGVYNPIYINAMCRYMGYNTNAKGKTSTKIRGIETKRGDSAVYTKTWQKEAMIKILDGIGEVDFTAWNIEMIRKMRQAEVVDIAIPSKLKQPLEDYYIQVVNKHGNSYDKKPSIGHMCLKYSPIKPTLGQLYYWLYVKPYKVGVEDAKSYKFNGKVMANKTAIDMLNSKVPVAYRSKEYTPEEIKALIVCETVERDTFCNAIAFTKLKMEHIKNYEIDWDMMINRVVLNKLDLIYENMGWDINKVVNELNNNAEEVSKQTRAMTYSESQVQVLDSAPISIAPKPANSTIAKKSTNINMKTIPSAKMVFKFADLVVEKAKYIDVKEFVSKHHYSGKLPSNTSVAYKFLLNDICCAVITFGHPIGRNVNSWLNVASGSLYELTRVASLDTLQKNSESYCIAQAVRRLQMDAPNVKYLISYADTNQGHVGYIYQASNWKYIGLQRQRMVSERWFIDGIEIHSRTLNYKHGTTNMEALEKIYGNRIKKTYGVKKHVYVLYIGRNKKERDLWYSTLQIEPYPKAINQIIVGSY